MTALLAGRGATAAAATGGTRTEATEHLSFEPRTRNQVAQTSNGILYNKQSSGTNIYTTYSKTGGSSASVRLGQTYSGGTFQMPSTHC